MATDYDLIAEEYRRAKQHPWRMHVEHFTMFELLGDLRGKAVLDLACGEGFFTRFIRQRGAHTVVGVDISPGMIELARQEELRRPLGIEYRVQDAQRLDEFEGQFDLVTAGYLLNYARTREELRGMCEVISRSLRPGGRFVGVNNNPAQAPGSFHTSRAYGFVKETSGELAEGCAVVYRIFLDDGELELTNYHLSTDTHDWAFSAAGLHGLTWHPPRLSPAGQAEKGQEYWSALLEDQPVAFIECRK
ncbi:MAG: novO [Armatimonadetes bacterium]|nr:novO [Armatimonadota bacterium]